MLSKSCLSTIRQTYPTLTAVERRVADYILENGEEVVLMPIADLAKNVGVAKSAVVRCAKSLGFEGYAELKIALTSELSKNKQLNYAPYIDPDDTPNDILDKIFAANIKTLHDTAEKLDRDIYGKTVDALASAEHIYVYGIGTSAVFANELQYRLMSLGMYALAVTDIAAMKVSTLNIRPGDVAVGISNSGRTTATIDALSLEDTGSHDGRDNRHSGQPDLPRRGLSYRIMVGRDTVPDRGDLIANSALVDDRRPDRLDIREGLQKGARTLQEEP